MEENQGENQTARVEETAQPSSSGVSFPTVGQTKKSGGPKTLLVLGILALVAILGFIIFRSASNKGSATPTPIATLTPVETPKPSATSTAKPADKSKVKIEVKNGTGITGEAAFLQDQLKALGYTNVTVGNATTQNATVTTVTFAKSLSADVVDEITKKLNELYKEVEVKTSTTATMDVSITTGLRKGATAKPSSTPTVKPSSTPTATSAATGTPTPTPTN